MTGLDDKIITSYSFLAALLDKNTDIYQMVYVPLFKRAIAAYALEKKKEGVDVIKGSVGDLQKIISSEYGINVPTLIAKKILSLVSKNLSRRQVRDTDFSIVQNDLGFKLKKFDFNERQNEYDRERRNTKWLQTAFEIFIQQKNYITDIPFSSFIQQNAKKLSSFFSGNTSVSDVNDSYMPHVRFLQHIENSNHNLYLIAEKIYIGSVIAAYLESGIDIEAKLGRTVYYLDTKIILSALDLQKQEDTRPSKELIELIAETGGSIKVLDITVEEIHRIIENAIRNYDTAQPTTTINEACIRRGKSRAQLAAFNGLIEDKIQTNLHAVIDTMSQQSKTLAEESGDINELQGLRVHKNAAHDVYSYFNVRSRRGKSVIHIQKAGYWFVTTNIDLVRFTQGKVGAGKINESITIGELTSLLFLNNPNKLAHKISQIGLNELIAQTISAEYPSKELINEFDSAIKTYGNLTEDEYKSLVSAVAVESTRNLENILQTKDDDNGDKFRNAVHNIITRARLQQQQQQDREASKDKEIKSVQAKNEQLQKQVEDVTAQLTNIVTANQQLSYKLGKSERYKRIACKIIVSIVTILVCAAAQYIVYRWFSHNIVVQVCIFVGCTAIIGLIWYFAKVKGWLSSLIRWIVSLGGLWGFISMVINIIKSTYK